MFIDYCVLQIVLYFTYFVFMLLLEINYYHCYCYILISSLEHYVDMVYVPVCRYRAKVEKVVKGEVHVLYIDYGNVSVSRKYPTKHSFQ